MDKWFNNKWFVRAISLAFAILLYVFVNVEVTTSHTDSSFIPSGSDEVETIGEMPVDIRIDSERYVVSGVPENVEVTLEGMNSVLTPTVRQRNFEVFVDLEGLGEGTHTVELEHDKVPNELTAYIEPKRIEVTIEERSSEEFPIKTEFINESDLPEGYELGDPEVNPETITITSSKGVIDEIEIVKVYIDVADLKEPINNREVPVNVYDGQGNSLNVQVEPESVVVSVDVHNPSKNVPVKVETTGDLKDEYKLKSITAETEEVEIFAASDTLSEITEITTEDIDLSKITESGTIDVDLRVPDGVNVSEDSIEVTIELEEENEEDKDEEDEDEPKEAKKKPKKQLIDFTNIPLEVTDDNDREVDYLEPNQPEMKVTVEGNEEDVEKVKKEDIHLSIDINDLSEGQHHVPVVIEGPEDVDVTAEFESITMEIIDKSEDQ